VLTAHHCAENVAPSTLSVRVGHTQRGIGGTFSAVNEIRRYPGYTGGHNDIALLRLSQYITNVPRVRLGTPAEAGFWDGQQGGYFTKYDDGLAAGWGVNATGAFPARLQFRGVYITTPQRDANGIEHIVLASAGPCGGDSGGPLLVSVSGTYVQAGVLKAATCGSSGASYSKVGDGALRDWVRTQIPDIDNPNPNTCKQGYVWRAAYNGDVVCVTPATRTQAQWDNYYAPYRRDPNGAWGPYSCISGYVWRVAKPDDLVCVTPAVRDQTAYDNSVAASRVN
jgi:Trypsin